MTSVIITAMVFGKYIKTKRKELGLTIEKLANICQSSRSYFTLIENGQRLPSTRLLPKIAKALKIKTGLILEWYLEEMKLRMEKELKIK